MIGLAENGLEAKLRFVDELVPIKLVDDAVILLLQLGQLLAKRLLDLRRPARLERRQIRRDDLRAERRRRVGEEVRPFLIIGLGERDVVCGHAEPLRLPARCRLWKLGFSYPWSKLAWEQLLASRCGPRQARFRFRRGIPRGLQ